MTQTRYMQERDRDALSDIDMESFAHWWTGDDFKMADKNRHTIVMVAEWRGKVAGYVVYRLMNRHVHVLRLAVHPNYRLHGVGRELLRKVTTKLHHMRTTATFDIPGDMLPAQKWLRSCGWIAAPMHGEDLYRFRYDVHEQRKSGCKDAAIAVSGDTTAAT